MTAILLVHPCIIYICSIFIDVSLYERSNYENDMPLYVHLFEGEWLYNQTVLLLMLPVIETHNGESAAGEGG